MALSAFTYFGTTPPAQAQDTVPIQFERGASDADINGTIIGDEYIDYVVNARAGQSMVVALDVTGTNGDGSAFFNIVPAGQDFPALYNGSTDDDQRAEVTLPESGDWAIRVYLMGNDRDTGKTVGYAINVYIGEGEARATQLPSMSRMERVRFEAGTTGAELSDQIPAGASVTYMLGASAGQDLYFRLAANGPGLSWKLFNPDGSLLDEAGPEREYRGELWQNGDHKVEVTNSGNATQSFNVIFGVE
ncbi:hypothetical protein [Roseivivax lentus]|uniref:hypothetical protein n=1 Tax=Roseivivax lentus TaxID=633194 RepID=UPI0009714777|nr:hypothetical protein [Roseivivax lentus]